MVCSQFVFCLAIIRVGVGRDILKEELCSSLHAISEFLNKGEDSILERTAKTLELLKDRSLTSTLSAMHEYCVSTLEAIVPRSKSPTTEDSMMILESVERNAVEVKVKPTKRGKFNQFDDEVEADSLFGSVSKNSVFTSSQESSAVSSTIPSQVPSVSTQLLPVSSQQQTSSKRPLMLDGKIDLVLTLYVLTSSSEHDLQILEGIFDQVTEPSLLQNSRKINSPVLSEMDGHISS